MIKLLFTLSFISLNCFAFSQTVNRQYDSVIKKVIERNIMGPECLDCIYTGVTLLEISKTDSISIRTLYASDKKYDFGDNKNLLARLKERCNDYIKSEYKVIVPVYFYYDDKNPPDNSIKTLENKIKKLKHRTNVMSPVYLTTFATMRKNSYKRFQRGMVSGHSININTLSNRLSTINSNNPYICASIIVYG